MVEMNGVVDHDHRMIVVHERPQRRKEPDGLDGMNGEHGNETHDRSL